MTREEEIIAEYEAAEYRKLSKGEKEFILKIHQWADKHPKNPWRDARLCPPENDENIFLSCKGVKRVGYYNLDTKTFRAYGIYGVYAVVADFWTPIPKTLKNLIIKTIINNELNH